MSANNVCLRNQILFYFKKGKKPKQAAEKICSVHGPGSIAEGAVRKWFSLFKMRDYTAKTKARNEKPPAEEEVDDVDVEEIMGSVNRSTIVEEIADSQTVSRSTVLAHLQLMESLVQERGYPLEIHDITTDDGYILTAFRIPHGRNSQKVGKPVILQHGLLCSSAVWVISKPEESLAFVLADSGYDVWLTNSRGNTYSQRHVCLDPDVDKAEYWNFSFHEMGYYDLPATIDFILNKTGEQQLHYVGHSQGTTQFFVMGSTRPEYNSKIKHMSALAPVSFLKHAKGGIQVLGKMAFVIEKVTKLFGIHALLRNDFWTSVFESKNCNFGGFNPSICTDMLFLLSGIDTKEFNESKAPIIARFLPAGASCKQLVHYSQLLINGGKFTYYDYGSDNQKHYKQKTVPDYDLSKVTTPIMLHYCSHDWVAATEDVMKLYQSLPNCDKKLISYKNFTHVDYMWASHAQEFVYKDVLERMNQY